MRYNTALLILVLIILTSYVNAPRQDLTFSTYLNKLDDAPNAPALYSNGEVLKWNYRLINNGAGFNTSVCFFLEASNRRLYDITNRPILERANRQYCENEDGTPRNPLPSYCPVRLNNTLVGNTDNQEVTGNIFTYTFTGSDIPYGGYRLIAQLRNPNDGCSNQDGSIIPAIPIAEYVNHLRYSAGTSQQIPTTSFGKIGYILLVQNPNDASQEIVRRLTRVKDFFPSIFQEATKGLLTMDTSDPVYVMQVTENMKVFDANGNIVDLNFPKVLKEFYRTHQDVYNFISVYGSFPGLGTTRHFIVKNSIKGIGLSILDQSSSYGSNGILKGVNWINMPLSGPTNIETLAKVLGILEIHELGHQWCCYMGDAFSGGVNNPRLEITDGTNHYYRGLSAPWKEPDGAQEWLSNNDGTFREKSYQQDNLIVPKYHPFTFYFMGILPESDYDRKYSLYDATNPNRATYYKDVSVRDIINIAGNRELVEPIRVIYPNGGENLIIGNSYEIKWTRNTLNTVTIILQNADTGQIVARLFESTPNDGSEIWAIPTNIIPNNNYKIFISYDNFRAFDTSDNTFRIST